MTEHKADPTPQEAADALRSIERLSREAIGRGLHSRWFALAASVWTGAVAVATAYDGGAASGVIGALVVGGTLGAGYVRRQKVARLRAIHGAAGVVISILTIGILLLIGLGGARASEAYGFAWLPVASGVVVAGFLFVALEILRRLTRDTALV